MAPLRIGVAGLGRAFTLMLPTFRADARVRLVAATDPRGEACSAFAREFGGRIHPDVAGLCRDRGVDVVYVATPHQLHANHVALAAAAGKHVLVEKPMAISLAEARAMIAATDQAGTALVVGHSHSFDGPVRHARALIRDGRHGALRMITALNFTDYMVRPRRAEELVTAMGGGVVFSQAAHQVDVVRLLGGGELTSVRAHTGRWDAARPTEGAYAALLTFRSGACASLTYSGYAHYDSDELMEWIGEMGRAKDPDAYGGARKALASAADAESEGLLKAARNYGGAAFRADAPAIAHQHFGFVIASCEHADLRLTPRGVVVHGDDVRTFEPVPLAPVPRQEVLDEVCAAVQDGVPPLHDGRWALATLEACLAILESARQDREIVLQEQVAAEPAARNRREV